jgi:hypothetical protein
VEGNEILGGSLDRMFMIIHSNMAHIKEIYLDGDVKPSTYTQVGSFHAGWLLPNGKLGSVD